MRHDVVMHDIVIRNGTIIDGTNTEPYLGEIAIDGDTIVAVGPPGTVAADGRREIDADGQIVTPGWVDMHTHYDAQATWDPYLTPAGWHGVTTVVMGNCGVGFAPAHTHSREWLIRLMEGVEDIPGAALTDGISWEWETFPEYLDALDRREFIADIGAQMPHGALRAYVMGDRSADGIEATPEEIRQMAALTEEALRAGALGFSTSRTPLHKSVDGDLVPGTSADSSELIGIAKGMAAAGHGVFECALHHPEVPESFGWLREVAGITQHPVVFNFNINDRHPDLWKDVLGLCEKAHDDGLAVHGQVSGRPVGILQCWDGTLNPFIGRPSFEALAELDRAARLTELLKPEVKAAILAEQHPDASEFLQFVLGSWDKMGAFVGDSDYEPDPLDSLAARAKRDGLSAASLAYDHLCTDGGNGLLYFPLMNYGEETLDPLREMHLHPLTRMGLADGGAHCGAICDGSMPTFMLSFWARDRSRGERMELPYVIHRQTQQTAEFYGLYDRGVLATGCRADVNVIDFENLNVDAPRMTWDLPTDAPRFVQHGIGYSYTIARGEITVENDKFTGALPGRLVRGPQHLS